jgi:hypothetical protein
VDAQATTTIRELATIRRTAGGPSQRRGYGEAGDAAGAMVGIATAYDGGCSASRFPHLKEGIGRNFLTRGRALVGGGSGSSPVRWICVTPHVSKPHDYVNHMFMRLEVLIKFEV